MNRTQTIGEVMIRNSAIQRISVSGLILFTAFLSACETPPAGDSVTLYPGQNHMIAGVTVSCQLEPLLPPDIVEEPEPEQPVAKAPDLILMRGETSEIRLPAGPCPAITAPDGLAIEVLEFRAYTATHESYRGLQAGEYLDALPPCETGAKGVWLDITAQRTAKPGRYEVAGKTVLVLDAELPEKPTMPFYAAVNWDDVKRLWGAQGDYATVFNRQMLDWVKFTRAHRIEPFVQSPFIHAPENLTKYNEFGIDYRELVIDGAIAPPILVRPIEPVSISTLQAIERRIQDGTFPRGSLGYLWDEGQPGSLAQVQARAQAARTHAPSLRRFVTWEPLPEIRSLYDIFVPVLDWRGAHVPVSDYAGVSYGHYSSCMAQGRCHDSGSPANPSGTPLMVVGSPEIHQRMFPVVVRALGGELALYYTLTKRLSTAWQPGGQWNEGGEGDGTALYYTPDRKPVASIRLKGIRKGMNDIEYARLLGFDLKTLVESARIWNKEHAPLDDLRVQLAKKLGALK